jgi:hypothetical protein
MSTNPIPFSQLALRLTGTVITPLTVQLELQPDDLRPAFGTAPYKQLISKNQVPQEPKISKDNDKEFIQESKKG